MPELQAATEAMITNDLSVGGVDASTIVVAEVHDGVLVKRLMPQVVGIHTGIVALSSLDGGAPFEIADGAETGTNCNILSDQKTVEFTEDISIASIGLTVQMLRAAGGSDTLKIFVKVSTDGGATYNAVPFAMWQRIVAPDTQSDRFIEFPAFNIVSGWRIQLWATQTDAITFTTVASDAPNDIPSAPAVRLVIRG